MSNLNENKILILDFGSQFTQLITRRIREIGVYSEIFSCKCKLAEIKKYHPKGIILSGGPESIYEQNAPKIPEGLLKLGVPILGICYGMQALAKYFGATISKAAKHEYGHAQIKTEVKNILFEGIVSIKKNTCLLNVWMSHGDQVTELPKNFTVIASTKSCPIAGFTNIEKNIYAIQFHPEVTHTEQGKAILKRFVIDICNCQKKWQPANIVESIISDIKKKVGNDKVLLALSGGVDSAVTAMLIHRAIGANLSCVFVDNGLLRFREGDEVMKTFSEQFGLKVKRVNAQAKFIKALSRVTEPETKRKIIGHVFIEIFEKIASEVSGFKWLAQGTIYPDIIESAASKHGNSKVIKSHHNVGGLPEKLKIKIIEPLKELFKDEVRKIGSYVGLSKQLLSRHPFPGPGLAVRILGELKAEYVEILRIGDAIFIEELIKSNWYDKVSQAFVVFIPVKSVGVVGDNRRYGYVLAIRAVQTSDFMTAKWANLPAELLGVVSNRIINEIPQVARVVYDISGKPPATIEWE